MQRIAIKKEFLLWGFIVGAFFALPLILAEAWVSVIIEIMIMAVGGTALNLLVGFSGVVSFGHAGFLAVGAYAYSLAAYYEIAPFYVAIGIGVLASFLSAVICGYFCSKMVEVYFALLALAFSQVVYVIIFNWYDFTKGDDGLSGVPVPSWLASIDGCYYFVLVISAICILAMRIVTLSTFGGAIKAIRENKNRVGSIGIDHRMYLFVAFVISGTFTGIAGILLAIFMRCAFPSFAGFVKSGELLLVGLLGGISSFFGPTVGSFIYILLDKVLSVRTEYWALCMGLLIVMITLFMRGGVVGFVEKEGRRIFRRLVNGK